MAIELHQASASSTRVESVAPPQAGLQGLRWRQLGLTERLLFTERLLLLQETGVSLHEGLRELSEQEHDPDMAAVLQRLLSDVLEGQPLSQAMAQHPGFFPATYVALVAAGERGGFLPQVLRQLLDLDEKSERLRSLLTSALSYPAFLTLFSTGTIIFVLVGVFPKFAALFEQIHDQLPWSTRFLMQLSELLRHHWPWLLVGAATLGLLAVLLWRQEDTRLRIDRFKLSFPGLRQIYVQVYLSQTLRVLGMSLSHGVPLVEALKACQDLVGNRVFRGFLLDLRQQVTEGSGLAQGFERSSFVPPMVQQMIHTGERTGSLATVMTRIAEHYERELAKRLALVSRLAEPVMLLVMGALIGLIVASLILPIFKLSRAIR
ncbi:type II secretion system F family protein [Ideonella paludis]|uniref:Type II secretion system F family protein n=1 Tax=Ideonella paludis TaxID=1233411 RepID=A0ABS5E248_9BURK|nr:type II secretion system F family protein [Ideonella paludis]MBQ0937497.1 type II secretion system F family protein [Ideonella paludis]